MNKIVESANVKVDEDTSKESNKLAGYKSDESNDRKREENIREGEGEEEKKAWEASTSMSKTPRYV